MATPTAERSGLLLVVLGLLWLFLAGAILASQLAGPAEIEVEWVTETEFETAGFNIYRSESVDGNYVQINERLIPSQGDPASGFSYAYRDRGILAGQTYYYRLEEVEFDNTRSSYEVGSGMDPTVDGWAVVLAAVSVLIGLFLLTTSLRQERSSWIRIRSRDLTQMSSGES